MNKSRPAKECRRPAVFHSGHAPWFSIEREPRGVFLCAGLRHEVASDMNDDGNPFHTAIGCLLVLTLAGAVGAAVAAVAYVLRR